MTLAFDDSTMLSGNVVRVPLPDSKTQNVYVYAPYVIVPYVSANLRTPTKVEQDVLSQSIVQHNGFNVISATNQR
jgi:hypothetical protein